MVNGKILDKLIKVKMEEKLKAKRWNTI